MRGALEKAVKAICSTPGQANSIDWGVTLLPPHSAWGFQKLRGANKRMQSDQFAGYAVKLAADAGRYVVLSLSVEI